jgi:hypothetical protein
MVFSVQDRRVAKASRIAPTNTILGQTVEKVHKLKIESTDPSPPLKIKDQLKEHQEIAVSGFYKQTDIVNYLTEETIKNIGDPDEGDHDFEPLCSEYVKDILKYLFEIEVRLALKQLGII